MAGHGGMSERPEVADLSDDELMARVAQARERVRQAKIWHDQVITDAMIRGINQTQIAQTAGVSRRAIFDIADREWNRRHAEDDEQA